jgi:hypothetical protein
MSKVVQVLGARKKLGGWRAYLTELEIRYAGHFGVSRADVRCEYDLMKGEYFFECAPHPRWYAGEYG